MPRLSFDCEDLLHWWEPKTDVSFIFNFSWHSLQQLREAITIFLSARLYAVSQRANRAIIETGCPRLKMMIASNPDTPADMLDFLVQVSPVAVIARIAENPNAGRNTLTRLAFHPDPTVRSAVADNPNTPESCFKRLTSDESVDVRFRIAENPQAPVSSLNALLRDENPYVSNRAHQTLARLLTNAFAIKVREVEEKEPELNSDFSTLFSSQLVEGLNVVCGFDYAAVESFAPELKF